MAFQSFALKFANQTDTEIHVSGQLSDDYKKRADVLISMVDVNNLDRINVQFVQQYLEDANVDSIPNDEDIPDELFEYLSTQLYGVSFNALDHIAKKCIIKTFAAYIHLHLR